MKFYERNIFQKSTQKKHAQWNVKLLQKRWALQVVVVSYYYYFAWFFPSFFFLFGMCPIICASTCLHANLRILCNVVKARIKNLLWTGHRPSWWVQLPLGLFLVGILFKLVCSYMLTFLFSIDQHNYMAWSLMHKSLLCDLSCHCTFKCNCSLSLQVKA